jgi:hypothetical protein
MARNGLGPAFAAGPSLLRAVATFTEAVLESMRVLDIV